MASFNDKWVRCPFYGRDDSNGIICEGVQDNTALRLMFQDKHGGKQAEAKRCYMETYCMGKYQYCRLARMLEMKYE